MPQGKAVIGQSGGPTAVINKSLVGFIKEATKSDFDEILGARHGLAGMLSEDFVDLFITAVGPPDCPITALPCGIF